MAESPISQEPSEMQISFMRILLPRINADTRESDHIRVYLRSSAASFLAEQTCQDRFMDRF
jgi:hypothetical protein